METKQCSKCKEILSLVEFYKKANHPDGLLYHCKQCDREKRGLKRRIPVSKLSIGFKQCNPCDQVLELVCFTKTKNGHSRTCKGCKRKYDEIYRQENKEIIRQKRKIYDIQNRKKLTTYQNQRKKYKCTIDPNFKLRGVLSRRIKQAIKKQYRGLKSLELLGADITTVREFLENQFKPGMTWKNHGQIWHIDHIIPCRAFNLIDIQQQKKCFHYTNLQPLFVLENIIKADKLPNGIRARDIN